jgi:hypothetical protein
MKISWISKAAIVVGINAIAFGGLIVAPANADPAADVYGDLVATGSDTTQDVVNGLALALGENPDTGNSYIASYDAAPGTGNGSAVGDCASGNLDKIVTQEGATAFTRPNGSGNGRDTLRAAIGQASSASVTSYACSLKTSGSWAQTLNATDIRGKVQFARSSSGPGAGDTTAAGTVAYVPFAKDAVSVAVSPTSKVPALSFGTATVNTQVGGVTGKVENTLWAIYTCKATKVVEPQTGSPFLANADYVAAGTDTVTSLKAYIPQSGSGTRAYWIARFNVTETNITNAAANASCLKDVISGGANDGSKVQEHSGLAVGADNYAVTPFSIPQFVAQSNAITGVTSRINSAVIRAIGGVNPTTGTTPNMAMNAAFTTSTATSNLGRLVYNIVPSRELDDPNSLAHQVFAGTSSMICEETATISRYGFAPLTRTTGPSSCGYTGLRAYAPSTAAMTIEVVDAATSGANIVTSASEGSTVYFRLKNLTSNGNGGGVVQFSDGAGNVFAELEVPAGSTNPVTATSSTWLYQEVTLDQNLPAGVYDVVADFIPTLPGVETKTQANVITFALEQREIDGMTFELFASTYKVGKKGKLGVTVEGTGVYPTGTVNVYSGTKLLGSADLADYNSGGAGGNIVQRELANTIINMAKFKKKGNVTLTIEYDGDDTYLPYETTQVIRVK